LDVKEDPGGGGGSKERVRIENRNRRQEEECERRRWWWRRWRRWLAVDREQARSLFFSFHLALGDPFFGFDTSGRKIKSIYKDTTKLDGKEKSDP